MQKDFHYDVMFVLANWAGFDLQEAAIIAYASQYVDDANHSGRIAFDNGASYTRTSSAHEYYDISHNADDVENHNTWLPFHFLPGNCGYPRGSSEDRKLIERLVCTPDSYIARDMVKEAIRNGNKPYGLHRFGIAMHTYADTWAHRGFAGVVDDINKVNSISWRNEEGDLIPVDIKQKLISLAIDQFLPVGHGPAMNNPDLPFLKEWQFCFDEDLGRGIQVYQNTDFFLTAVENIIRAMRLFLQFREAQASLAEDLSALYDGYHGLNQEQRDTLQRFFLDINDEDADKRHEKWMQKAVAGEIPGIASIPQYIAQGEGSWKWQALVPVSDTDPQETKFKYSPDFPHSDWKQFHDGLQMQRLYILLELLPSYGICAS